MTAVATIGGVAPYCDDGLDFLAGMAPENVTEFNVALEGRDALTTFVEREDAALRTGTGADIVAALGGLVGEVDAGPLTDAYGAFVASEIRHALSRGFEGWLED